MYKKHKFNNDCKTKSHEQSTVLNICCKMVTATQNAVKMLERN